jgi:hypothetical protein
MSDYRTEVGNNGKSAVIMILIMQNLLQRPATLLFHFHENGSTYAK